MKVFYENGILVIAVLIAAKGIYVTAFMIVQETFTNRNVVYFCKFLAQVFKRTIALYGVRSLSTSTVGTRDGKGRAARGPGRA